MDFTKKIRVSQENINLDTVPFFSIGTSKAVAFLPNLFTVGWVNSTTGELEAPRFELTAHSYGKFLATVIEVGHIFFYMQKYDLVIV